MLKLHEICDFDISCYIEIKHRNKVDKKTTEKQKYNYNWPWWKYISLFLCIAGHECIIEICANFMYQQIKVNML